jgi:uncharacterized protein YbaP (TraB family)
MKAAATRSAVLLAALLAAACHRGAPPTQAPPAGDGSATTPDLGDDSFTPAAVKALADEACPTIARPYLWRIPSRTGGRDSFLFGSMHIGIDPAKLPSTVTDALLGATKVVLETDPALEDDDDGGFTLPPDAPGLDAQLGPELWPRYLALMGATFADPESAARLTPATATILLSALYLDKTVALDSTIGATALQRGVATGGLETSAFQEGVLAKWMDLRALRGAVRSATTRRQLRDDQLDEVREYCAGTDDSPGLDAEARAEMQAAGYSAAELDEFEHDLLWSRNQAWIPLLTPMLDAGGAFITVGADHLRGERGVIALLQATGFAPERVAP